MERVSKFQARHDQVFNRLYEMSSCDRIRLIDSYAKKAEQVFHEFPEEQVIEIVTQILRIKFSKQALIDSFLAGDPVVDSPGCRLDEYLLSELAK